MSMCGQSFVKLQQTFTKSDEGYSILIITDNNDGDCAISKIRKTAFKEKIYVIADAAFSLRLNNLSVSSFTGFSCVME